MNFWRLYEHTIV